MAPLTKARGSLLTEASQSTKSLNAATPTQMPLSPERRVTSPLHYGWALPLPNVLANDGESFGKPFSTLTGDTERGSAASCCCACVSIWRASTTMGTWATGGDRNADGDG